MFCGCGLKCFSPLRVTIPRTTYYLFIFFLLNTLNGTAKAPGVELLRLTLRGLKTVFLTLKRYDEHQCFFFIY